MICACAVLANLVLCLVLDTKPQTPAKEQSYVTEFGYSFDCAGDLDGDGTVEFLIASPFDTVRRQSATVTREESSDYGGLWLCSLAQSRVIAELHGDCLGTRLGESVITLDAPSAAAKKYCLVGEPGHSSARGRARMLDLPSLRPLKEIAGPENLKGFGADMAEVGRDGDKWIAVIMCQVADASPSAALTALVSIDLDTGNVLATHTFDRGYKLARRLAKLPDLDFDGIDEVAVGVPTTTSSHADYAGRVDILSGRGLRPIRSIQGTVGSEKFGTSIAVVNNPGSGDSAVSLLIGASGFREAGRDIGNIYRYDWRDGSSVSLLASELKGGESSLGGFRDKSGFGSSVAAVPDVTGDGIEEFVVGAPLGRFGFHDDVGWVGLFSGGDNSLVSDASWRYYPRELNVFLGGLGSHIRTFHATSDSKSKSLLVIAAAEHPTSIGISGVLVCDLAIPPVGKSGNNFVAETVLWQLACDKKGFRAERLGAPKREH